MKKQEKALQYFNNKFNCSQSVFTVFGPGYGISEDDSLRIACAFGGGMGRQQLVCGVVTGALMALGLKYGKALNDDDDKKKETYAKTIEFCTEFRKIHGSVNCLDLLDGLSMTDPEDSKKIEENNFFETRCRNYVIDAVRIAEKMMV